MAYSAIVKPSDYFNTLLYTGNGNVGHAITGVGFQPDFVWLKERSSTSNHQLGDAVRGATKYIQSNVTDADGTDSNRFSSFNSDGFTQGANNGVNESGQTYASWNWKGNGAGSTNNDGNRTSTVSASTTSGFSIVRYQGNNSNNQTIGHGLGVAPKMIIIKDLTTAFDWIVYNKTITAAKHLHLNTTAEAVSDNGMFNGVEPTASVFNIHANNDVNKANDYFIAYCFAEKVGYSKIGSYTGNGNADGPFVYTGFKPAFILSKRTDAAAGWVLFDNKRLGYNGGNYWLDPQANNADATDATGMFDQLANGFKIRSSFGSRNSDGGTYIYMAFAANPLVANSGTDGVPATAR